MEEQIITVHIPKDQYRKFAQIAWQVNCQCKRSFHSLWQILQVIDGELLKEPWQKIGSGIIGGAILNERIFWVG